MRLIIITLLVGTLIVIQGCSENDQTSIATISNYNESLEYSNLLEAYCASLVSDKNDRKSIFKDADHPLSKFTKDERSTFKKEHQQLRDFKKSSSYDFKKQTQEELYAKFLSPRSLEYKKALEGAFAQSRSTKKNLATALVNFSKAYPEVPQSEIFSSFKNESQRCID
ncbi:hypothetical protein [Neolewinella agarilytica]|uniref:Lipoprotein n=1 Tax=Neolewinella agarilytica TaxID=478744 RepID=A0A1H9MGS3_9BACT|nr:hypothetical protein [Neolewinella agarilytica]SER22667.1 hypothetical protein SAMN05444359_1292 [Neolewinella agarilytica]